MRSINGERNPLERPFTRRALQTELATGDKTHAELAERYGVTSPAICAFKKRHAAKIQTIRDNAADEFAGLEISKKVNRLEGYEDLFEAAYADEDWKQCARILRNVAEEMGHLPSRMTIAGQVAHITRYEIDGVDQEDLT